MNSLTQLGLFLPAHFYYKRVAQKLEHLCYHLLAPFHREVRAHRFVALLQVRVVAERGLQEARHPQALGRVEHVVHVACCNANQIHQRKLAFQQGSLGNGGEN